MPSAVMRDDFSAVAQIERAPALLRALAVLRTNALLTSGSLTLPVEQSSHFGSYSVTCWFRAASGFRACNANLEAGNVTAVLVTAIHAAPLLGRFRKTLCKYQSACLFCAVAAAERRGWP